MQTKEIEQYILGNIPITNYMGLTVKTCDLETLSVQANFEKNKNHQGSAFGGSVGTLLTLTCWSWFYNYLKNQNINAFIVIQSCTTNYKRPILNSFTAICSKPEKKYLDSFLKIFSQKGRARLELQSHIQFESQLAAEFTGRFVAMKS